MDYVMIKFYVNWALTISRNTICMNRNILEWQFFKFFMIFRKQLANFAMISREISKIMGIGREQDFMI